MTKFILDTNTVSYFADDLSPFHKPVTDEIAQLDKHDSLCLSILTIYELDHGIASMRGEAATKFSATREFMIKSLKIFPLTIKGSEIFGMLKTGYMKQTGITKDAVKRHDVDLMIASSAITENAVLVSNDRIFERLQDLHPDFLLENWTSV